METVKPEQFGTADAAKLNTDGSISVYYSKLAPDEVLNRDNAQLALYTAALDAAGVF